MTPRFWEDFAGGMMDRMAREHPTLRLTRNHWRGLELLLAQALDDRFREVFSHPDVKAVLIDTEARLKVEREAIRRARAKAATTEQVGD